MAIQILSLGWNLAFNPIMKKEETNENENLYFDALRVGSFVYHGKWCMGRGCTGGHRHRGEDMTPG